MFFLRPKRWRGPLSLTHCHHHLKLYLLLHQSLLMQSQLCVQHLLKHVLFMCSDVCHHVDKCGSILTFNLNLTFRSTNGNSTTWSSCLCHLANYAHRYSTRSCRNLWGWSPALGKLPIHGEGGIAVVQLTSSENDINGKMKTGNFKKETWWI